PVFGISAIVNYSGIQASPLSSPTRRSSDLEGASLVERVRWLIDSEINPHLAAHRGRVALEAVDADGVVWLRFGGGCHGCGMADVTLKQGIEKTLRARLPVVREVRDVTDHSTGTHPYISRA